MSVILPDESAIRWIAIFSLHFHCLASNEMLKLKFREMHLTIVNKVNTAQTANIINFLFQERVIAVNDTRELQRIRDDPQQQCSELLTLLHASENPQAFVKLYAAINGDSELRRLNNCLINFQLQSQPSLQYRSNR